MSTIHFKIEENKNDDMHIYIYINFQIELKEKYIQKRPRASKNETHQNKN